MVEHATTFRRVARDILRSQQGDGAKGYRNGPSMVDSGPIKVAFCIHMIKKYQLDIHKKCRRKSGVFFSQKTKPCGTPISRKGLGGMGNGV
jgi:hypothetical protein